VSSRDRRWPPMRVVGLPRAFYHAAQLRVLELSPRAQARQRWLGAWEALRGRGLSAEEAAKALGLPRPTALPSAEEAEAGGASGPGGQEQAAQAGAQALLAIRAGAFGEGPAPHLPCLGLPSDSSPPRTWSAAGGWPRSVAGPPPRPPGASSARCSSASPSLCRRYRWMGDPSWEPSSRRSARG